MPTEVGPPESPFVDQSQLNANLPRGYPTNIRTGASMKTKEEWVVFHAAFPEDRVFDDEHNEGVPGGKNILQYLVKGLRERGFAYFDPEPHEFYGWYSEVRVGNADVWLMIHSPDYWLIVVVTRVPILKWILGERGLKEHEEIRDAVSMILCSDARFSDVQWMTTEELDKFLAADHERAMRERREAKERH
jgi:hypothetical protein